MKKQTFSLRFTALHYRTFQSIILFVFFVFNTNISFSQTSNPPPSNYERGMYVDCADDIVRELSHNITTKRDQLVSYANSRHITYMALYRLDAYANAVLTDINLQPFLSDLIVYLKANVHTTFHSLEVGIVISSKNYPTAVEIYNYGGYETGACWPIIDQSDRVNGILNPDQNSTNDEKRLALMARNCISVRFYNDGYSEDALNIPFYGHWTAHAGKFDWISIEDEYWHTAVVDPNALSGWSLTLAYQQYIDLISMGHTIYCQTLGHLKVESELLIIDYQNNGNNCNPYDANHPSADLTNFPTGQAQADAIDNNLNRILMVDYSRYIADLFNKQCHNFYFMGNSSTNKPHTRIWPLFSAEFPNIGQVRCSGAITDDCAAFLGLALQPTVQTITYTCDGTTYSPTDGGHDFFEAEDAWIYQKDHPTSCLHCNGTDYYTNNHFVQNISDNRYDGFMWFTYSIMDQMQYHRLAHYNSYGNNINSESIFPNPNSGVFTIKANSNIEKIIISDSYGNKLKSLPIPYQKSEFDVDLSNYSAGIYFIQIIGLNNISDNYKFILQK